MGRKSRNQMNTLLASLGLSVVGPNAIPPIGPDGQGVLDGNGNVVRPPPGWVDPRLVPTPNYSIASSPGAIAPSFASIPLPPDVMPGGFTGPQGTAPVGMEAAYGLAASPSVEAKQTAIGPGALTPVDRVRAYVRDPTNKKTLIVGGLAVAGVLVLGTALVVAL